MACCAHVRDRREAARGIVVGDDGLEVIWRQSLGAQKRQAPAQIFEVVGSAE